MIDVAAFLEAISPEAPCGENLEYDPIFSEMERSAVGKPEQQFGGTIIPAEDPDWKTVSKRATELLTRSKDLRVAVYLARAEIALSGWPGVASGLQVIEGFVVKFWDGLHPQLDPDDDNDPVLRVNTLETLCDHDATLRLLKGIPLVSSRTIGRFNLRDVAMADGDFKPPEGTEAVDGAKINAAFADVPADEITVNAKAVRAAVASVEETQKAFNQIVGSSNGINLGPLKSVLLAADKVYSEQLSKRGASLDATTTAELPLNGETNGAASASVVQKLAGEISTRQDVVTAIDKVCDYYAKHEPSSPLPLLLDRCKRLVSATFLEIIKEVIPDSLDQAKAIGGRKDSEE